MLAGVGRFDEFEVAIVLDLEPIRGSASAFCAADPSLDAAHADPLACELLTYVRFQHAARNSRRCQHL